MKFKRWDDCSQEEQIERWQQVTRVLQNLSQHEKRHHFDMGIWGRKTDCGTVACAAGHCGLDSWFRRRGFALYLTGRNRTRRFDPRGFFGEDGCFEIFLDTRQRPCSAVIKEIKAYIRQLKHEV